MATDTILYSRWQKQYLRQKRSSSTHPRVGAQSLEALQRRRPPALNRTRNQEQNHPNPGQPRGKRDEKTDREHVDSLTYPTDSDAQNPMNPLSRSVRAGQTMIQSRSTSFIPVRAPVA
ncbi:hypothetical protein [Streptomyces avermitilis]|uniref:hypothetical protein n=1 Tax=Streptomyces avermitilis TaxID=33903 RepID=UPI0033AE228C